MKTSFKTASGNYITAEGGGGTTVVANRTAEGPWEMFEVEDRPGGVVALRTDSGFYLGTDSDGHLNADATTVGEWEEWEIVAGEREGSIALRSAYFNQYVTVANGGGGEVFADSDEAHDWESLTPSVDLLNRNKPSVVPDDEDPYAFRPVRLAGPLKTASKVFFDDSGPIAPFFASFFPIMALARRDREAATRKMEKIAALYPGFRTFLQVGGWTPYWDGLEVNLTTFRKWFFDANNGGHMRPAALGRGVDAWPISEYNDVLRFVLRTCQKLGIRLDATFGDMQILCPDYGRELQLHDQISRVVQEEGGTEVVAMVEACNEFPINHAGGDSPESKAQLGRILDVWRSNVPGILTAMGAIIDDSRLTESGLGNVNAVHVDRGSVETHLKHTFGVVYQEGHWRQLEDAVWFTEPMGPGSDSYMPNNDPANLTAIYMLHQLLGCGSSLFEGGAVRGREELGAVWGFNELPVLAHSLLPRGVHLRDRAINSREGGVMYWHKDKEFHTIVFSTWNPAPPADVDEWTLHAGTSVRTGRGNPPKGMTGLLVGKFK